MFPCILIVLPSVVIFVINLIIQDMNGNLASAALLSLSWNVAFSLAKSPNGPEASHRSSADYEHTVTSSAPLGGSNSVTMLFRDFVNSLRKQRHKETLAFACGSIMRAYASE